MGRIENLYGQAEGRLARRAVQAKGFYSFADLPSRSGVSVGTQAMRSLQRARMVQSFADATALDVAFVTQVAMDEVIAQVIQAASEQTAEALIAIAESARVRVNRRQGLARIHEEVADLARRATIRSLESQTRSESYRDGRGRLPGRISQLLNDPSFIRAQRDGIFFGNAGLADRIAVHWRRLNFGAGALGRTRHPQTIPLVLHGTRLYSGNIGFVAQPSPPFNMPFGGFLGGGEVGSEGRLIPFSTQRGDQFFPYSQIKGHSQVTEHLGRQKKLRSDISLIKGALASNNQGRGFGGREQSARGQLKSLQGQLAGQEKLLGSAKPTRGIRGIHFMDAGLFVLANRLPDEYARIGRSWVEEGVSSVRVLPHNVTVS